MNPRVTLAPHLSRTVTSHHQPLNCANAKVRGHSPQRPPGNDPVPEAGPRLDQTETARPRRRRPVDLADPSPATPSSGSPAAWLQTCACPGSRPALPGRLDPRTGPAGIPGHPRHTARSHSRTETRQTRPRQTSRLEEPAPGHPVTTWARPPSRRRRRKPRRTREVKRQAKGLALLRETHWLPNWLPKIKFKNLFDQSGRRDLNPRPLDPPSHERTVWPGRTESAGEPLTCDKALKASRAVWTSRLALAPISGFPWLPRERGYPCRTKINDDSMHLEIIQVYDAEPYWICRVIGNRPTSLRRRSTF